MFLLCPLSSYNKSYLLYWRYILYIYICMLFHPHLNGPARFQHAQDFAPGCVCTSVYVAEGTGKGLFFTLDSMRDLSTDVRHTESPRQSELKSALRKQWHGRDCLKALAWRISLKSCDRSCQTKRNCTFSD